MPTFRDVETVLKRLRKAFPNPGAMHLDDPFRTLVGVVLSARTRDEQVLALCPTLFGTYPTAEALAAARVKDVEKTLATIGMFRQKAKNVVALARMLVDRFGGKVPRTMEELVSLPGVGRKTASVLLVACFDRPAIAVDTHVFRLAHRLGWAKGKTPERVEVELLKLVPPRLQPVVNPAMVKFGRYVCLPGAPRCWACPVREFCAFKGKRLTPPENADEVVADIARREAELESARRAVIQSHA